MPTSDRPIQDCARCRNLPICWSKDLQPEAVVINLLVCRIKTNNRRDHAMRLLLAQLKDKISAVARSVAPRVAEPVEDLECEIQAYIAERLIQRFDLSEGIHPLYWLFNRKSGAVEFWARERVRSISKQARYVSYSGYENTSDEDDEGLTEVIAYINKRTSGYRIKSPPPDSFVQPHDIYDSDADRRHRADRVMAIIDDGVTLSTKEYRTLAFCVQNAREPKRTTGAPKRSSALLGLHRALAKIMGVGRVTVTRIYAEAVRRVVQTSGETHRYLRNRGLTPIIRQQASTLIADEIYEMVQLRTDRRVSVYDLALMFSVSERVVRMTVQKFTGKTRDEIREICSRRRA